MAEKVLQLRARCWGLGRSGPPLESSESHGTLTNLIQAVTGWDVQNSAREVMSPTGRGHKVIFMWVLEAWLWGSPEEAVARQPGRPSHPNSNRAARFGEGAREKVLHLINQSSRTECAPGRECRGPCPDGNGEDPKVTRMEQSAADTRRQGPGEWLSGRRGAGGGG